MKMKPLVLLAAILGLGAFLRLPSLTFPIWLGDESYYVGLAQNFLNGRVNYVNDYHHIPPGITYIYSIPLFLFGANNMLAVHLATLLAFSGTTFFIYRLASLLADEKAGLLAALLFSVHNVCFQPFWCFSSMPESFIIFFSTLGLYLLLKQKKKSVFFSGVVLAVSVLLKQNELIVVSAALIYLIVLSPRLTVNFLSGLALVLLSTAFFLIGPEAWGDLFYQNFNILLKHLATKSSLSSPSVLSYATDQVLLDWARSNFVVLGGAVTAIIYYPVRRMFRFILPGSGGVRGESAGPFLQKGQIRGLVLIAALTVVYGLSLFWLRWIYVFYLLLLLPYMAVLAGVGFSLVWRHLGGYGRHLAAVLLVLSLIICYRGVGLAFMGRTISYTLSHHRFPLMNRLPVANYNPELVNEVIKQTKETDRVLVWGWYCWVNVLADRRFGIGLLETETLAKAGPELHHYLYQKLERQLKEDGPEVIIDFPGAENSRRISDYPQLAVWISKYYQGQPFLEGTLYRKIKMQFN